MIFWIAVVAVVLALIAAFVRTAMLARSTEQEMFSAGAAPAPLPDGLYAGSAKGYSGSWRGKKFDRANKTGINVFAVSGGEKELYPFAMSVGKSVRDNKELLLIDYDIEGNPFWLRPIVDEVVEVKPGELLGRLQYRLIPGYPFTLTFFKLEMK